jgi:hypothetical protein
VGETKAQNTKHKMTFLSSARALWAKKKTKSKTHERNSFDEPRQRLADDCLSNMSYLS